jgi:hypothetical protein
MFPTDSKNIFFNNMKSKQSLNSVDNYILKLKVYLLEYPFSKVVTIRLGSKQTVPSAFNGVNSISINTFILDQ